MPDDPGHGADGFAGQTPDPSRLARSSPAAGPDEQIGTPYQADGITPGNDDFISVVYRDPGKSLPTGPEPSCLPFKPPFCNPPFGNPLRQPLLPITGQ